MSNQYGGSKWSNYDGEIKSILNQNINSKPIDIVTELNLGLDALGRQALSKYIRRKQRNNR